MLSKAPCASVTKYFDTTCVYMYMCIQGPSILTLGKCPGIPGISQVRTKLQGTPRSLNTKYPGIPGISQVYPKLQGIYTEIPEY